jgi:hypothetical protein
MCLNSCESGNACERTVSRRAHSVSGRLMGCLMKNGIATHDSLSHEYYVLRVNGQANSIHRRYKDAVKAGLLLKYQFPQDDIKVCEVTTKEVTQGTVLH